MAADQRLFFKLHNGFPEHPKSIELSDKAFRQLIEAWCYCSRNLNDGRLTKAQFVKLFSAKSRKELLAVGFVVETENGYEMHDYLEHQQSAEDVETRRIKRAMAGSKGGKAKAAGVANARQEPQQTPGKSVADTDTDTDTPTYVGGSPRANQPGHTGTRIPGDFKVTPQMLSWALDNAPNVNTKASTQKFRAHYRSVSGPAQFKTDWTAAWETWLLGDQERAIKEPQQFKTAAEKRLDQGRANHDLFAQMDAERENAAREITA